MHTFVLCIPEVDWEHMQENTLDKKYRMALLLVNNKLVGHVGIRYKGFDTLTDCVEEGTQTCPKISMKLKFDKYDSDLRFAGLKGLHFNSMVNDPSLMREQLAYSLFRSMDVPAPQTSYGRLIINGEDHGVFSLIEQVDDVFVRNHIEDSAGGVLFKELWPTETRANTIRESIKAGLTNPVPRALVAFSQEMHSPSTKSPEAALGKWVDIDHMLRFLAVDRVIANSDGVTALYCDDGDNCGSHNFYMYKNTSDKFTFIPWDLEGTFNSKKMYTNIPEWDRASNDCTERFLNGALQAPGCDPILRALAVNYKDQYQDAIKGFVGKSFHVSTLNETIDARSEFLRDEVASDSRGPTLEEWEHAVAILRNEIDVLYDRAVALGEGGDPKRTHLSLNRKQGWEESKASDISLGVVGIAAPSSKISPSLYDRFPIEGNHDLRVDFEYHNDVDPWQQWGYIRIQFDSRVMDLRDMQGIRITMRADQSRTVAMSIDSDLYTNTDNGALYGWTTPVQTYNVPIQLPFTELRMSSWAPTSTVSVDDILASTTALRIAPLAEGVILRTGYFPEGSGDKGYLHIDNIEFY